MAVITIYHNPKCSKSRQALQIIQDQGLEPEIILYLKNPPDHKAINHILSLLHCKPIEIIRDKEAPYHELGLGLKSTKNDIINAIISAPILLERPIVIYGNKAVIARPPEKVLEILPC